MLTEEIVEAKIIAIIRGMSKDKIMPIVQALYDGGVRFVEVTYPQGEDETTTFESIRLIAENFKGKMHVGAGTVLTQKQVRLTKKAGGEFIISPDVCPGVITLTKSLHMVSMPGAFSPTEIMTAVRYGADFVKIFPASELGPSYIKAVRAPLKNVKMLAVGGVNLENIPDFRKAGVCGFGIGSNIVDKKMVENGDYEGIKKLAEQYVKCVNA